MMMKVTKTSQDFLKSTHIPLAHFNLLHNKDKDKKNSRALRHGPQAKYLHSRFDIHIVRS